MRRVATGLLGALAVLGLTGERSCSAFLLFRQPALQRPPMRRMLKESDDVQGPWMSSLTSQEERADDAPCVDCMDSAKSLKRDRMLAAASAVLAAAAFLFQRSAPVSAVALLHQMEADSPSLTAALDNGKPTIIDIYADWCDNCKSLAPVTRQLEREFGDSVNWVTVRGDAALRENQAVVRALRADAIPHYAFVRADGQVETSLIGAVPARVLRDDVKALAEGRQVPFVQFDSYRGAPSHNIRDYLGSDFFPRTARPETR